MKNGINKIWQSPILLLFLVLSNDIYSQDNSRAKLQITEVFNKLVDAYGSAKSAPELKIVTNDQNQNVPSAYYAYPNPTIKVDIELYNICYKFGKDNLNAMSIILGHELAHY